jgi:hypothetical protein
VVRPHSHSHKIVHCVHSLPPPTHTHSNTQAHTQTHQHTHRRVLQHDYEHEVTNNVFISSVKHTRRDTCLYDDDDYNYNYINTASNFLEGQTYTTVCYFCGVWIGWVLRMGHRPSIQYYCCSVEFGIRQWTDIFPPNYDQEPRLYERIRWIVGGDCTSSVLCDLPVGPI